MIVTIGGSSLLALGLGYAAGQGLRLRPWLRVLLGAAAAAAVLLAGGLLLYTLTR